MFKKIKLKLIFYEYNILIFKNKKIINNSINIYVIKKIYNSIMDIYLKYFNFHKTLILYLSLLNYPTLIYQVQILKNDIDQTLHSYLSHWKYSI